ncbi:protein tyrosine phosphatase type IVA 2 [Crotalus adamanteus]|uniref:Protein tyrosine phosphatase type IVA 2 n=1 Tax=Crotalus adamanteus TaxID=8729 RepID=A0AAW1AYK9_CROAD
MNRPAPVEITYETMRFLITHNPTNATLTKFTEELKKYGVTTLVRVCDATYDKAPVEKEGIQVLDWPFDDGAPPPGEIVEDWFNLLKTKFREEPGCCVAVHCVAGLGRAPVLVALALIECGMKYEDAVQFIRQKRRGAFNSKQLLYLEKYRPKMRLRFRDANGHCIVHGAVQEHSSPAPSALLAHRAGPAHRRADGAPPTSGAGPREASGAFPGRRQTSLQGGAWIVRCWTGRPLGRGLWVVPSRPVLGCWSWLRRERSEETTFAGLRCGQPQPER